MAHPITPANIVSSGAAIRWWARRDHNTSRPFDEVALLADLLMARVDVLQVVVDDLLEDEA
jgi:hypothetical protein